MQMQIHPVQAAELTPIASRRESPVATLMLKDYGNMALCSEPAHSAAECCLQAPGRARLTSPSNEGSLSYTVGDLKERLRALKLPLHGRKAELLDRLKAALAADTAASAPEMPAAAAQEATDSKADAAETRVKPRAGAAAVGAPDGPVAGTGRDRSHAAAQRSRKRVQPGTAGLGSVATAEVRPHIAWLLHSVVFRLSATAVSRFW